MIEAIIANEIVKYDEQIGIEELHAYVEEEKELWAKKGKKIGHIEITIEGDEVAIKTVERSPITRTRRITGYLSTEDRFNDAKQAELHDRQAHTF